MGVKCPECNKVYVPPRQVCEKDFTDIRDNWVELENTGTVTNFTVVRYDDKHLPAQGALRAGAGQARRGGYAHWRISWTA